MKKIFLLMCVTLILSQIVLAQQKLWTVLSDGGIINSGGNGTYGVIIVYDPVANTWTSKHNFAKAEGTPPTGAPLIASDGNLYGTTNDNGGNGFGSVWKYDIANDVFTVLHHFTSTTGRYAHGNLMQAANGKIYGVTEQNGANNKGTLFELTTTGTVTKLVDFSATNGYQAFAKLIEAAPGKLIGVTLNGGANNNGVLFEYDYTNNIYTKKIDLSAATTGSVPWGDMIKAPNGKFYGMTSQGGTNSIGTIYEYDYSANTLTVKQSFTTTTGSGAKGALVLAEDGTMYGMTELNGVNNKGTLFQYDYINNTISKKIDFSGTANGSSPNASLTENNGKLYGMTVNGGTNNGGTIFEYDYAGAAFTKKIDFQNTAFGYTGTGFPFMSSFVVQNCPAVTFNAQPANATVCTSGSTTFSVTASGTGLGYQWQIKTGSGGYANLTDNTTYSGSTSGTLTVNATSALNGYYYRCLVTSSTCSGYSGSALLTVNSNPSVTPSVAINVTSGNSTMCSGSSITFTATPTNGGTPSYQWKVDGANVGTNSTTYTSTTLTNNAVVTCVMTSNALCANAPTAASTGITMNVTTTVTPSVAIAVTSGNSTMCAGSSITFTATTTNGGAAPSYQWKVNGGNTGTNATTYSSTTLNNSDVVSCVLTSNAACASSATATSNNVNINVSANLTPSVAINVTAGSSTTCSGNSVTFTATPANGGTTPAYQWRVNGGNVGTGGTTYTSTTLTNSDAVTCVLTSNATCVTSATATSNTVTMNVTTTVTPSVAISVTSGNSTMCAGSSITFTPTPTNGGTSPVYQWNVNGTNTATGATFTSTTLTNGAAVTCVMTSNANCVTATTATSNGITMNVTANVTPSVSITITSGSSTQCAGNSVTFTATPASGGSTPSYQWKVNGGNVGTGGTTYTSSALNNSDAVTCDLTSNATCVTSATATSNTITMNVSAVVTPSVAIAITSGNSTTCSGIPVTFTATPTNGGANPSYQWKVDGSNVGTGASTFASSTLANGAVITCDMTSNATCVTSANASSTGITMNVTASVTPSVSISVTTGNSTMCAGNLITFTAAPTNGGTTPAYQWKVNGSNVGTGGTTYTSTTLINSDAVTCELTSNATCASAVATSNTITMNVSANLTPSVAIAVTSGSSTMCTGSSVTFTATPTNGGASPSYQWKIGGSNAGTGATFTSTTLANGDVVTCDITSNASCLVSANASSAGTTMNVTNTPPVPTITADLTALTLTSSSAAGNQWYINGVALAGETSPVLTFSPGGSYTVQVSNGICTSESLPYEYNIQTGTSASALSTRILVYPNPSEGIFKIALKDQVAALVTVKDMYGTNLYSGSLNGASSEIDLSDLDKGIYFIHVVDGAEEGVVKIILN